jgi:RNA polymerase sigma factor (sigma-70 family)
MDDNTPLRQFVEAGSQEAFRELVGRHTDLVYACAMQRLRDAHAAQDVTQAVFLTLALKAKNLRSHTSLAGWLFTTTRYVATRYQRGEQRRKEREMRAFEETQIADSGIATEAAWEHMQPHLAGALDSLSGADREAVLLRFYRKASHQEVATALGTSEDGARKRVDRALDKLRRFITNKGVALSATALTGALTANAAPAAPAGLAATAGTTALAGAGGTLTATSTLVLAKGAMNMLFWNSVKTAAVGVAAIVTVAGGGALVAQEVAAQRKAVEQPATAAVQPVKANADAGLEPAANKRAQQELKQLCVASEVYRLDTGHFPTGNISQICLELSGKSGQKLMDFPADRMRADGAYLDPWGAAYEIVFPTAVNVIARSSGKDRAWGTVDDVVVSDGAWGAVTNELQAGFVPLGGVKGWKGFLCPDHTNGIANRAMSDELAARKRCCRVCGAPKPWSATFGEGEPMGMELHVRNQAKEACSLLNAGVRFAPAVSRYWGFTFTPAGGGTSWMAVWPLKPHVPPESDLKLGVGDQNETAVELHVGGEHWIFEDRQDRQGRRTNSLPPGKYTVTASYAHPEHKQARAPIPVSPAAAAEIAARQAARPGGEDPAAKPCPYWHGTVTTGTVQIEIKADDAEARFLEAAKYAGFAAVAEVKALPQAEQAGDAAKLSQLGIEWKELLYAPDATRQALSVVNALTFPNTAAAELKIGDRILVAGDKVTRYVLPGGSTLTFEGQSPEVLPNNGGALLDGVPWLLWTQSRQDALQAALAPGWRKGACPWCHRGADSDYPVCACRNGCEGKGCTQRQKQRGGCIVTAKGGGFCERTVGPATRDVTFRLWAFDPNGERNGTPRNECRIQPGAKSLPLWVEVQNEKSETSEFQTPGGGKRFDCCKTLFYLVEGPGLSGPTPAFHGDGGARARMMMPAALQKGSATGQIGLGTGKLFATPGTYTVRAVAGRLISNPVKVEVAAYTPAESAERSAQADAIYRQGLAELEAALKTAAAGATFDDLKVPYEAVAKYCGKLHELGDQELGDRLRGDLQTRLEPHMKAATKGDEKPAGK